MLKVKSRHQFCKSSTLPAQLEPVHDCQLDLRHDLRRDTHTQVLGLVVGKDKGIIALVKVVHVNLHVTSEQEV